MDKAFTSIMSERAWVYLEGQKTNYCFHPNSVLVATERNTSLCNTPRMRTLTSMDILVNHVGRGDIDSERFADSERAV